MVPPSCVSARYPCDPDAVAAARQAEVTRLASLVAGARPPPHHKLLLRYEESRVARRQQRHPDGPRRQPLPQAVARQETASPLAAPNTLQRPAPRPAMRRRREPSSPPPPPPPPHPGCRPAHGLRDAARGGSSAPEILNAGSTSSPPPPPPPPPQQPPRPVPHPVRASELACALREARARLREALGKAAPSQQLSVSHPTPPLNSAVGATPGPRAAAREHGTDREPREAVREAGSALRECRQSCGGSRTAGSRGCSWNFPWVTLPRRRRARQVAPLAVPVERRGSRRRGAACRDGARPRDGRLVGWHRLQVGDLDLAPHSATRLG